MTELELAEAMSEVIETTAGGRRRVSDRHVRYLLSGKIQWPWPDTREALERVLGRSAVELGFTPRGGASTSLSRRCTLAATGEGVDVERREVLGAVGGGIVTLAVPELPARGRLGVSDVARLREPLTRLIAVDDQVGGVNLAPVAARQAQRILGAIERYELSSRTESAMYALAGEYLTTAGWFAVDASDFVAASEHLDRALRAASIAGEPLLQAEIWNDMAMRARQAGAYNEALAVAKAGLHSTAARNNPKVRALFHARVAQGHAFRGEYGLTRRSLDRSRVALGQVDESTVTPAWLAFVDEAEVNALATIAFRALGRFTEAEDCAKAELASRPASYARNRVHGLLNLAEARLGRHEVEQAAGDASVALDLAGRIRSGLHTGRIADRLRQVRREFGYWRDVPAAQDWARAYDLAVVG